MSETNQGMTGRLEEFILLLDEHLSAESRTRLAKQLYKEIPDRAEFETIKTKHNFVSENERNPRLLKQKSRDSASKGKNGKGMVPGFDGSFELTDADANKHFKRLCEKYCNL